MIRWLEQVCDEIKCETANILRARNVSLHDLSVTGEKFAIFTSDEVCKHDPILRSLNFLKLYLLQGNFFNLLFFDELPT